MKRGGLVRGWMGGGYFSLLTCRLPLTRAAEGSSGKTTLSALGCIPPLRSCADSVSLSPPFNAVSRVCVRQAVRACVSVCGSGKESVRYNVAQLEKRARDGAEREWDHMTQSKTTHFCIETSSANGACFINPSLFTSQPLIRSIRRHSPWTCMPCRRVES